MRKFKKAITALAVATSISLVAPTVLPVFNSVQTVEAKVKYTTEEKKLAKALANYKNSLSNPDAFKIKSIEKGSYVFDEAERDMWSYVKNKYYIISDKYKYRVCITGENTYGGTVSATLYLTSKYKIWDGTEGDIYFVAEESENISDKTKKNFKTLFEKYYDEMSF